MGAVVQILGAANRTLTVFTDEAGYYTATGLLPGLYTLKVTAPSFLPALREKVGLRPGGSINVNITLSTLLGAMQLGPIRALPDDDDWKWTLRSVANRPILRIFDDIAPAEKQNHEFSGAVAFVAGSAAGGYGTGSDMTTSFTLGIFYGPSETRSGRGNPPRVPLPIRTAQRETTQPFPVVSNASLLHNGCTANAWPPSEMFCVSIHAHLSPFSLVCASFQPSWKDATLSGSVTASAYS